MEPKHVESDDEFKSLIAQGFVIVDFYADWCGPCKMIAPKFKELAEKHPKIKFLKVNVDDLEQTVVDWNVSAMPSFFLFKDGQKVDEVIGADQEKLKNMIENCEKSL